MGHRPSCPTPSHARLAQGTDMEKNSHKQYWSVVRPIHSFSSNFHTAFFFGCPCFNAKILQSLCDGDVGEVFSYSIGDEKKSKSGGRKVILRFIFKEERNARQKQSSFQSKIRCEYERPIKAYIKCRHLGQLVCTGCKFLSQRALPHLVK